MKGHRINQSVAPTYFMMLISTRRFITEIRMVLMIIIMEITPSSSITSTLPTLNTRLAFSNTSVSVCPCRMLSIPSIFSNAVSTASWFSILSKEIEKEWDKGLFSPSRPTKISSSAPQSFFSSTRASEGEIYSTLCTWSIFAISSFIFSICSPLRSPFRKTEMPMESSICPSIYRRLLPTQ